MPSVMSKVLSAGEDNGQVVWVGKALGAGSRGHAGLVLLQEGFVDGRQGAADGPGKSGVEGDDQVEERDADDDGVVAENQEDGHRLGVADT